MSDKLGTYITQLMTTIVSKEQTQFVKDLAYDELNRLNVAKTLGSMPELVNFGIKASTVRQFLTSAGLPTKWSNRSKRRSTKDLAKIAKNQTVMVVCNP